MGSRPTKRPTIRDIAERAGVSYQTVSRVMNNHPGVAPKTQKRVTEIARKMGYRPNRAAQMMHTQRSYTIEVVAVDMYWGGGLLPTSLVSIANTARQLGYHILLSIISEKALNETIDSLISRMVDGFILLAPYTLSTSDEDLITSTQGVPFVWMTTHIGNTIPAVYYDQEYGTRLAAQHLYDLGHRQIVELRGMSHNSAAILRHQAWLQFAEEHNLDTSLSYEGRFAKDGGYDVTNALLQTGKDFTAIMAANDDMALGAMRALHEHGLRVPEDVSVIGFDDLDYVGFLPVPLTTIRQDFDHLGKQTAEFLISRIEEPDMPAYQRVLNPELIVRQSTTTVKR